MISPQILKQNFIFSSPIATKRESIDYEKLLEEMTQAQITHNHDIDIMVKTLHSHPLTIPDVANHSVRAKESCCFGKQVPL